jgi:hypothetical protein
MKKVKKTLLVVLMLVVAVMMVVPLNATPSTMHETTESVVLKELQVPGQGVRLLGETMKCPLQSIVRPVSTDTQVTSSDDDENHPTIAEGSAGEYLVCYEGVTEDTDQDIWVSTSIDSGATWNEIGHIIVAGFDETYPSFDYSTGEKFFGTFTPDPTDDQGGIQYLVVCPDINDPDSWELWWWTWGAWYNCTDRGSSEMACDTYEGMSPWEYGVVAFTHTGIDDGTVDCPVMNYADHDQSGYGWYYFWYLEDCAHAACEIDRTTDMVYAAYDWYDTDAGVRNIILLIDDFTNMWPYGPGATMYQIPSSANNMYPTVAADNNNVMIIAQTDENGNEDIICYYSSDGGQTTEVSTIADSSDDELYPDAVSTGENTATCTFIKNGDLYFTITEDGGETWSTPVLVNDETGEVAEEHHAASVSDTATVWMDERNGNYDIYFDKLLAEPILKIEDITGGFGVSAVVKNVGDAEATELHWEIAFEGGFILFPQQGVAQGDISAIGPTSEEPIDTKVLGLGGFLKPLTITITVEAENAATVEETVEAKVLLFFALL